MKFKNIWYFLILLIAAFGPTVFTVWLVQGSDFSEQVRMFLGLASLVVGAILMILVVMYGIINDLVGNDLKAPYND